MATGDIVFRPRPVRLAKGWIWFALLILSAVFLLLTWLSFRITWGLKTLHYELTPSDVVLVYGTTRETIPRHAITNVRTFTPTGGRRLFGTGLEGSR